MPFHEFHIFYEAGGLAKLTFKNENNHSVQRLSS